MIPGKIPKSIPRTEIGDRKPNDVIYTIPYFIYRLKRRHSPDKMGRKVISDDRKYA